MKHVLLILIAFLCFACGSKSDKVAYKDAQLPVEERVSDLLKRMTLKEKVAQMHCVWNDKNTLLLDSAGNFDAAKAKKNFVDGLGQVGRP
ncbi:MAG TPA: hypothetical protein PLJ60_19190, partial [Chryseolinea sp.]|nr:hypothetical protein [Chryseolinea sp.]